MSAIVAAVPESPLVALCPLDIPPITPCDGADAPCPVVVAVCNSPLKEPKALAHYLVYALRSDCYPFELPMYVLREYRLS